MKNYSAQYQVQAECPQCGAAIILRETDFILHCEFCRTRVALYAGDYFQYYIMPREPVPDQVVFVPYWRFRGMCFFIVDDEIKDTYYDSTFLASYLSEFPQSLGVRTQVLTLHHIDQKTQGQFLEKQIAFKSVREQIAKRVHANLGFKKISEDISNLKAEFEKEAQEKNRKFGQALKIGLTVSGFAPGMDNLFDVASIVDRETASGHDLLKFPGVPQVGYTDKKHEYQTMHFEEFIGETISLIYFPYYIQNGHMMDGVIHEPVFTCPPEFGEQVNVKLYEPARVYQTVPLLCPHCGWDVKAENDTLLYFCANCEKSWLFLRGQLKRCRFEIEKSEENNVIFLPFWRIQVDADHLKENPSQGTSPKSYQYDDQGESVQMSFYIPGIRIRPRSFLQTAHYLNNNDPAFETDDVRMTNQLLIPLSLPLNEAVESIPLVIAHLARRKKLYARLKDINIKATKASVIYMPFRKFGIDLIHPAKNFSIRHADIRDVRELEAYLGE